MNYLKRMGYNPVVITFDLILKGWKLAMKTPQWVIDIAIALLFIVGIYGFFS